MEASPSALAIFRRQDLIPRVLLPDQRSLLLVPLEPEHAASVVAWRNDPVNRARFLSDHELSVTEQLAWTEKQRLDPTDLTLVAMADQTPVAMVAIYGIDARSAQAEYGRILVDNDWRRRGVGSAVSRWVVDFAFAELGLDLVYANCLADNRPIHGLLAGLGFQTVKKWRHEASQREVLRLEVISTVW